MLPMHTGSTAGTAALRGLYNFFCTFVTAAITSYMGVGIVITGNMAAAGVSERDRIVFSVLTGILAGMGALGFRGAAEGLYDTNRDAKIHSGEEEPKPSDVGQPNA